MKKNSIEIFFLIGFLVLFVSCQSVKETSELESGDNSKTLSDKQKPIREILLEGGNTGILLIHGYAASSLTMRPLAHALNDSGYTVLCPLLPGHGSKVENLEKVTKEDYYKSIEKAYKKLAGKTSKVIVIGHSLGSLLAIRLSVNHKIDGVILVSPPLLVLKEGMTQEEIHNTAVLIGKLLGKLPRPNPTYIKDPDYFRKYGIYTEFPPKSLEVLAEVVKEARKDIQNVDDPLLIILGNLDPLVDTRTGDYIEKMVKSKIKRSVIINSVGHRFFIGEKMPVVIKEICGFISDIEMMQLKKFE